ncbi:MAG: methyltransferase RsmF C-terminal domain-like protein [Chitinophagaceae bacterium]
MIPQPLIQSLQKIEGFNENSFIEAHKINTQITSIRLNQFKGNLEFAIDEEQHQTSIIPWCKLGRYLQQRPSFTFDPLFHAGAYYVQEASSMFLWEILKQICGELSNNIVLDLCAAPGGKSTLLSNFFHNGFIISNEVIKQRASVLVENVTKWGSDNIIVTNNDPKDFKPLKSFFDCIVIDAPCSGSGLFRKDAKAIEEWSEENVNLCSGRQKRIIADITDCLNENGLLIYSTCSYSKQENEDVLDWISENYDLETIKINIANDWGIVETQSDVHKNWGYRFYPYKVKGEGFFIAAFRKKTAGETSYKLKETILTKPLKQEIEIAKNFTQISDTFFYFKHQDFIKVFPSIFQKELQIIASYLYIKKAGIAVGMLKGKDLIPAHELAMSYVDLNHITYFDINKDDALQYLSKKEVNISSKSIGWALIKYEHIALGWIKVLPNRINNYYPIEWRILKSIV